MARPHMFSNCSAVDGHLGDFSFVHIGNSAMMDIPVQVSVFHSLGFMSMYRFMGLFPYC